MKNKRVTLTEWNYDALDDNYNVNWPKLQRERGSECVKWLLAQPESECQLLIEHVSGKNKLSLVAEFYNDKAAVEYTLRWG